jgi:hypothetical protein
MVCWEVNTVTLEFKAKNVKMIIQVLNDMRMHPQYNERANIITSNIGTFNLKSGTVETEEWKANAVNDFRVKYSEAILMKAAKAKKWVVKKRANRQFVVKKW